MKPEALRLADALDAYWAGANGHDRERQAAAELRRLHDENKILHQWHHDANLAYTRVLVQRDALLAEHQQTLALQQRSYEREIQLEVEAEREACAKVCGKHEFALSAADEIRARGNK